MRVKTAGSPYGGGPGRNGQHRISSFQQLYKSEDSKSQSNKQRNQSKPVSDGVKQHMHAGETVY